MRHLFLWILPYMIFVYPTIKIYIIIAMKSNGRSPGQFEKDGKVSCRKNYVTEMTNINAEIPVQHQPADSPAVHEPDPHRGSDRVQPQLHQHHCSSSQPPDLNSIKVVVKLSIQVSKMNQ